MEESGLVLGIDTGGTYTDAILMDYAARQVVATCKRLTTRRDFALGIAAVIDGIHLADPAAISMVSISTTLATNAIAEGKGRRVGLLLLGYDPDLIAKFKLNQKFGTADYAFVNGGHDLHGREKTPLDLPKLRRQVALWQDKVDAIAVSGYFSPLNPAHELAAQEAIGKLSSLPVVMGHQLSTRLGSIERATTAALNASLLSVLQELIRAVKRMLQRRGIVAPLMVMRGDGTLMDAAAAAVTPVATIHSGPAASAIGGRFLARKDAALVIDVGGTTTDIALIVDGTVDVIEEGAMVNGYKTAVKAAHILSIPLGGDSHLHLEADKELRIGPERVVPLAFLAAQYPLVREQLGSLFKRQRTSQTTAWLEYWFLARSAQSSAEQLLTGDEEKLLELLADGPQPLPTLLKQLGRLHAGQLELPQLWRREILAKGGLTPTDLLHVTGSFTPWAVDAAAAAVRYFYRFLFRDEEDMHQEVWRLMTAKVVRAVLSFLTAKTIPEEGDRRQKDQLGAWFLENSLYDFHPQLETSLRLRMPIIGIGAPAEFFLPRVAEILHTQLILPQNYAVANAVGTVASNVMIAAEALVFPVMAGVTVAGYIVQGEGVRAQFETLAQALAQARTITSQQALDAAQRAGAYHPQVTLQEQERGLDTYRVRASAVGSPRLSGWVEQQ